MIRQACILVGGKGTRLGALTSTIPKPLLDIGDGMAFLDLVIEQLSRQGFDDIVLLAGYLARAVEERYHDRKIGSARIRLSVETTPLGTAGALVAAKAMLAPRFLMLNGDSFFDVNLRGFAADSAGDDAAIALRQVADASRYGAVDLKDGRIVQFREKDPANRGPALINGGIYLVTSSIVDHIASLPCSIETEIFPGMAREGRLAGKVLDGYFLDIGLPETLERGRRELRALRHRPAAFLDRDGVINADHGYVHRPEQVEWIPGARDAIRRINDLGYRVVVVTNQAGVAHGYYEEEAIHALHAWMNEQLATKGAFIDAFYHCPYHPEARVEKYRASHQDRKPAPGMLLRALADLDMDRDRSFLIGDRDSDIEAARQARIPGFLFPGGDLVTFVDKCLREMQRDNRGGVETSLAHGPRQ